MVSSRSSTSVGNGWFLSLSAEIKRKSKLMGEHKKMVSSSIKKGKKKAVHRNWMKRKNGRK